MDIKYPKSKTHIDDMREIIKFFDIKKIDNTDCTVLYEVTFDQLRAIYNLGKDQDRPIVNQPIDEIDDYINSLTEMIGRGGNDPLIKNAIVLISMAKKNGYSLDMKLGHNCPTFRESANTALMTVSNKGRKHE